MRLSLAFIANCARSAPAAAVLLACTLAAAHAQNQATDWNAEFLTLTQASSGNLVAGPPEVAREIAIFGNAMSDAVNAATGATLPYYAYSGGTVAGADPNAAAAAAAYTVLNSIFTNSAWQTPISNFNANPAPNYGSSNVTLANTVLLPDLNSFASTDFSALGLGNPATTCAGSTSSTCLGYNLGVVAANAVIAAQASDGAIPAIQDGLKNNAPAGSGATPGVYVPPASRPEMFPTWGSVTPTGITGTQLTTALSTVGGPPQVNSAAYANALLETECEGSGAPLNTLPANVQSACAKHGFTQETTDQAKAALFWNDPGTTSQPPGHWLQIANTVLTQKSASLLQSARLTALLGDAENDAGIAAWGIKYTYNLWRPVTAITTNCNADGTVSWNPAFTTCDPTWSSLIATPPHPDYLAGHPAFSGAAATVLAAFFGTDDIGFTSTSNYYCNGGKTNFDSSGLVASCTLNNVTYSVSNPQDCAQIVGGINVNNSPLICPITESFDSFSEASNGPLGAEYSRVVGGIHTPFSVQDALTLGDAIGQDVANDANLPEPSSLLLYALPMLAMLGYNHRVNILAAKRRTLPKRHQ